MSQGWIPYEFRYRIGLVVFLASKTDFFTGFHGLERNGYFWQISNFLGDGV
jgi:hypothetical protein